MLNQFSRKDVDTVSFNMKYDMPYGISISILWLWNIVLY